MAGTRGPLPPRISAPDLPTVLEDVHGLGPRADLVGVRIAGLSGDVDAVHSHLADSAVAPASISRIDLTGATLTDVEVGELRATEVVARNSRWRSVRVQGGRVGTLDLSGCELSGVELRGLRIGYLSLREATATDLLVVDCTIEALDLPLAILSRVAFVGVRVDEVTTDGLRAENVDLRGLEALSFTRPEALRGATLSERQVHALAVPLALAAGIHLLD